jgi:hypothetical protein
MARYECVSYVACSIGNPDLSVQIFAPDNSTAYKFVTEVVGKMPGVIKTQKSILPIVLKCSHNWRVPTLSENGFEMLP